jgi:peptidoglycan-associated lipoprotein
VSALVADATKVLQSTIYFDYDQSTLTDPARELLGAKVPVMQARPTTRIRITGHTDNRGSAEYNLALGLRRAAETKAYLVANGVDADRIDIFSLGAERPAVEGEGEDVWSKNRRAEFQILSRGEE